MNKKEWETGVDNTETVEGGRKPTKGRSETKWNCATEHERWRDEQTKQERVWSNIQNWGTNPVSFLRKNDLSSEFWAEDIAILLENSSILNQQATRTVNSRTEIGEKQTELIVNGRQITETNQQQESYTTRNQEWLRLSSLLHTTEGLWSI